MYLKATRTINLLVVILMSLEIVGASVMALPFDTGCGVTIRSDEDPSSVLGSVAFEKAEEENEKTEEENAHLSRVVLLDFSQVALSLCASHSPDFDLTINTACFEVRPPLHQLHCVFLL